MAWKHYRLVFRLKSPLHIGYRKVGNLMQTRRYVPGKNIWAALTERIVWLAGQGNNADAYQEVGKTLREHFRFGYLWPTYEGRTADCQPHFPWEETDPAYWDYLYLDGIARTALASDRRVAAEGALHEVEFIAPYTREGQPVYLVGDLWVQDNLPATIPVNSQTVALQWQEALQYLQIGGERTYGWGRVRCCSDRQAGQSRDQKTTVAGYSWAEQNGEVVLILKDEKLWLPAHARAAGTGALSGIVGPVEPWLGWERDNESRSNKPWRLSEVCICWAPGSRSKSDLEVKVTSYGVLEQLR